jgi:hypothetical protein
VLEATGGIVPTARCLSTRALSLAEREETSRGIAAGSPLRAIFQNKCACRVIDEGGMRKIGIKSSSRIWQVIE